MASNCDDSTPDCVDKMEFLSALDSSIIAKKFRSKLLASKLTILNCQKHLFSLQRSEVTTLFLTASLFFVFALKFTT